MHVASHLPVNCHTKFRCIISLFLSLPLVLSHAELLTATVAYPSHLTYARARCRTRAYKWECKGPQLLSLIQPLPPFIPAPHSRFPSKPHFPPGPSFPSRPLISLQAPHFPPGPSFPSRPLISLQAPHFPPGSSYPSRQPILPPCSCESNASTLLTPHAPEEMSLAHHLFLP